MAMTAVVMAAAAAVAGVLEAAAPVAEAQEQRQMTSSKEKCPSPENEDTIDVEICHTANRKYA